jgi:hypothetical protein
VEINFIWLALGLGLVFFGKKLFWIFIGAAGFIFGFSVSQTLLESSPMWVYLAAGAICAGVAVMLIRLLKNIAFGLGGFAAGVYIGYGIQQVLELDLGWVSWVVIIVCGVIGAALMLKLFEMALIILTAGGGALLVTQSVPAVPPGSQILFLGLVLLGILSQSRRNQRVVVEQVLPPGVMG